MTKNNSNWKDLQREFIEKFGKLEDVTKFNDELSKYDYVISKRDWAILTFFKPYFQEKMHEISIQDLEGVDNQKG